MTGELETAIRDFLKSVLREVVEEVLCERRLFSQSSPSANTAQDERFLLRAREAANRLAISERHLHKLTVEGVLPCVRVGRLVHYSVETIEQWIRETESTDPPKPRPKRTAKAKAVPKKREPPSKAKSKTRKKSASVAAPVPRPSRRKSAKPPKSPSRKNRPKDAELDEESVRTNPFRTLLNEIGIDRDDLGPLTNGELMGIAEVDIPVFHGWMYLGRQMPEEALEKLRQHFRKPIPEGGGM